MNQAMQVAAGYAESASGLGFAPAVLAKGADDEAALEAANLVFVGSDGSLRVAFDGSVGGNRRRSGFFEDGDGTHRYRKLRDFDSVAFGENNGALDDVFEFADVAGPIVIFERL